MIKKIPPEAFKNASSETWRELVQRAQLLDYESALMFPVELLRHNLFVDKRHAQTIHIRKHTLDDDLPREASRTQIYFDGLKDDIRRNGLARAVGIFSNSDGTKIRIFDGTHRIWAFHQLFQETGYSRWEYIRVHFLLMDTAEKHRYVDGEGFVWFDPKALTLLRYFEKMFQFKLNTEFVLES